MWTSYGGLVSTELGRARRCAKQPAALAAHFWATNAGYRFIRDARHVRTGTRLAIDVEAMPGPGVELVLTVDGEWRRSQLFRSHDQPELVGAIADTRATFEAKAGHDRCSEWTKPWTVAAPRAPR